MSTLDAPETVPDGPDTGFCAAYREGRAQILTRTIIDDLITPVAAMLRLGAATPNLFLMESVQGGESRGRYSMIGLEPDMLWRVCEGKAEIRQNQAPWQSVNDDPVSALRTFVEASRIDMPAPLAPMAAGLFGYLGYDMVRHVETLGTPGPDPAGLPDALLMRPTLMAIFDSVAQEIVLATPVRPEPCVDARQAHDAALKRLQALERRLRAPVQIAPVLQGHDRPAPAQPHSNTRPQDYRAMVERIRAYIRAGDVFQVVPSQRFSAPLEAPPFALYRALRRMNPSPFLYYLNFEDFAVIGSSPEILVRVRDRRLTIRPIAGTRPRGAGREADEAMQNELLDDPKERAEHLMLLDLGRNDAARVCSAGSVRVTAQFTIERYSRVMHMVSNVEGELASDKDAVDALFAGFPAGTVSGAPKIRAMQIIDELETQKRGLYAGAIGYFSANGDLDTCIALRTAVVRDGVMHVQAGGGVVLDSDAEAERMETVHKASALFRAAEQSWRFTGNTSKPG